MSFIMSKKNLDFLPPSPLFSPVLPTKPEVALASGDIYIRGVNININEERDSFDAAPVRRFSSFVFSHIYSGQGRLLLAGQDFRLAPGATVLLPPETDNLYGGIAGSGYQEDYVVFDGAPFRRMMDLGLIGAGVGYLGTARRLPQLNRLLRDGARDSAWRLGLLLQEILLEATRSDHVTHKNLRMNELFRSLNKDYSRWWSVKEMSDFCHLSEAQFRRCFLKKTGMNPKHYQECMKLQEAARNLVETVETIETIAEALGYRDRFHFSSRFKAFFGIPPAQYRTVNSIR